MEDEEYEGWTQDRKLTEIQYQLHDLEFELDSRYEWKDIGGAKIKVLKPRTHEVPVA